MRLIFVNRFFYPDHSATSQLLTDLALGLAERRSVKRGDIVIAMTDPPLLSVIAAPIAKLRRARLVNWLQDLFPEVAENLKVGGRLGSVLFRPLRWMRNASLRNAAMNVAIGELMADRLLRLEIDRTGICVLPNWADCDALRPVDHRANALNAAWQLSHSFTVGYSGNLGRAHDIETLLDAIGMVEYASRDASSAMPIRWLFIGGGILFESMKRRTAERGLQTVDFQPYQPRERLSESLSAADVHIVSLKPELEGLIVPSKFYGVAAAGRPTLFIGAGDGEIARVLKRNRCGLTIVLGDAAGLARAIQSLASDLRGCREMGERARAMCEALYSKTGAIQSWHKLVCEIAKVENDEPLKVHAHRQV